MRIAVTRPEEDAEALAGKLAALGHEALVVPLLTIVPRSPLLIEDLPYQAIIATSANAIRALSNSPSPRRGRALRAPQSGRKGGVRGRSESDFKSLRMLTVGPQSLNAASEAGFANAEAHGGDVNGLAQFIHANLRPDDGPLLYISGQETAGDLKGRLDAAGFTCARVVLYDAVPAASLGAVEQALRDHRLDAVMLYSPRSARIWRELAAARGLEAQAAAIRSLCLSANAAAILPEDWRTEVAAAPHEAAMLALLAGRGGTR